MDPAQWKTNYRSFWIRTAKLAGRSSSNSTKQKAHGELQKITRPAFDCKEKEKGSALKRNDE